MASSGRKGPRIAPRAATAGNTGSAIAPVTVRTMTTATPAGGAAAAGDLLFFAPGSPADQLVARATGGPYAHVAVATGDGHVVEALHRGVVLDTEAPPALILPTGARCRQLAAAQVWLHRQVGRRYSYADLVDAAEAIIFAALQPHIGVGPISVAVPPAPFGQMFQPGCFDCSSLAARFLLIGDYAPLPDSIDVNPDACSPNSLAWALGARW